VALWGPAVQCAQALVFFLSQHLVYFLLDDIKSIENNVLKLIIVIIDLLNAILIMSEFGFGVVSGFDSKGLLNIGNLIGRYKANKFRYSCMNFVEWMRISLGGLA
jgi:hypothetical protein